MKRLLALLLLAAAPAFAQTTPPACDAICTQLGTFGLNTRDATNLTSLIEGTIVPTILAQEANAAATSVGISNLTTQNNALQQQLNSQAATLTAQNQLIAALQQQIAQLQAAVAALTPAPPVTPPTPAVLTIQAESFNNTPAGQPALAVTCPGGTGVVTCNSAAGETLTYAVNIPVAGKYQFAVSVASNVGGTLSVNGNAVTTPNTGSFATYQTVAGPILTLAAGTQTLTVVYTTAHQNLDFYTLTQQ